MANAGEILIQADLDIASLVNNSKRLNNEMENINSAANTAQGGFKKLETQTSKTAQAVKSAISSMRGAKEAIRGVGYQIQDMAVQAEMGTSAIRILGQQGPQILSLFGPLGAIAGAALTVFAAMSSLGGETKDAKEQLDAVNETVKRLQESFEFSADGTAKLNEEMVKLKDTNNQLYQSKLALMALEASEAMKGLKAEVEKVSEEFNGFANTAAGVIGQDLDNSFDLARESISKLSAEGLNLNDALQGTGDTGRLTAGELMNLQEVTLELASKYGIAKDEAGNLLEAMNEMANNPSPATTLALANVTAELAEKYQHADSDLVRLNATMQQAAVLAGNLANAMGLAGQASDFFANGSIQGLITRVKAAGTELAGKISKIHEETKMLRMSAREQEIYKAQQEGATQAVINAINAKHDEIAAIAKEKEQVKQAEAAKKKAISEANKAANKARREQEAAAKKAQREAEQAAKKEASEQEKTKERLRALAEEYRKVTEAQNGYGRAAAVNINALKLGANATEEQKRQAQELAGAIYDVGTAMANMNELAGNLSPTLKVDMDFAKNSATINEAVTAYQNQLAKINSQISTAQSSPMSVNKEKQMQDLEQAKVVYTQAITEAEQMRSQIEEQYRQQRIAAQWEEWKQASAATQIFGDAVDAVMNSASSSISGLLMGTQSLKDSLLGISNTILNSVIQSIVEMGMAQVKSMIMGEAASAAVTSSSIAQAATIAQAWAPAAASVSLATNGANAGPAQAGMAAVAAAAVQTLATPGRKLGGAVSANKMYRVGENNQPELYKASNGMQYMIPGSSGRVFSNKDSMSEGSGGGGGSVSVVINQTNHFGDKESRGDDQQLAKGLAKAIEATVKQQLTAQMRPGGMLSGR